MSKKIKVCSEHQAEQVTPLIWTFAFIGAEYWCPYCGNTSGMLGAGEDIDATPELVKLLTDYKKRSKQYLRGNALKVCSKTKYKGKWIKPSELPSRSKAFWHNKSLSWEYEVKQ